MPPLTRRQFIGGVASVALAGHALAVPARALAINPRDSWATDRPPLGPLPSEDVRFLLVHHSASHNGHTGDQAAGIIRSFYDYHTSAEKGWNDIAYNFLIDADGGIWEGRYGSLSGAVAGDATGGNQGFSQLVCVIGDYNSAQPSAAAKSSLVQMLAWLADRHAVSTAPGAEVSFVSRGSNKWPEGTTVSTPTITGHRTMSKTTCPGDNLYSYVAGDLTAHVEAVRSGQPPSTTTPSSSTSTTTTEPVTTTTRATTTTTEATTTTAAEQSTTTTRATTTTGATTSTSLPATTLRSTTTLPLAGTTTPLPISTGVAIAGGSDAPLGLLATAGAMIVTGAGLLAWRYKRMGGR